MIGRSNADTRFGSRARACGAGIALLTLAACAQSNSAAELAPAAAPQSAPLPPQQAAPPPPQARQAALTPEEAKGQCWMKYENDRRAKSIDDRLKLVEKCVDETLRNQPPQPPAR